MVRKLGPVFLSRAGARAAGFTLVELMVVIAVLSVLAVGVTLSVGRPKAAKDLATFQEVWHRERALAIEGRDMRGLEFGPEGLGVLEWRGGEWRRQGATVAWRGRVVFAAQQRMPSGEPDVVFRATGQSNAFRVQFSADGQSCTSDGWAELSCG